MLVDVHCNLRVDPSGAGVCGVAFPVYSPEAIDFRVGRWKSHRERAFMAQSDSAPDSESGGSGFESR